MVKKHIDEGKSKSASVILTCKKTGISKSTIWFTIKQMKHDGKASQYDKLSGEQKKRLRKVVHNFFINNEIPNLSKIYQTVKDDNLPPISWTNLWRILRKLGFKYEKRGRNHLLVEKSKIVIWRKKYIDNIKRHLMRGYQLD
ncbi:unnamed protein product [Brassicogethes aeneus]|uniref:Uncharacterized protein n=1 Tax=Brassicogethes aeneus TaxID=1431903 RepID=A0A9P0B0U8_BRAAE|nr:unnamed protein product [Brassicogethes aeneus]